MKDTDSFIFKTPGAIVDNHMKLPDIEGESQIGFIEIQTVNQGNGNLVSMHVDPVIPGDGTSGVVSVWGSDGASLEVFPGALAGFEDPLLG